MLEQSSQRNRHTSTGSAWEKVQTFSPCLHGICKPMCGYDRCVAPSAPLQVNRQYLRDVDFESVALRESIAENSLNVHHQPEQSEGCGGGEKELSAFVLQDSCQYLLGFIYRVI